MQSSTLAPLAERHRPRQWSDVVGQDAALARIEFIRSRGVGAHAFWISGNSGVGKTTVGRLLAADVADELCVQELDAAAVTPRFLAEWGHRVAGRSLIGGRGWALLLNESHGLRQDAVRALLTITEHLPSHAVVVFTTSRHAAFETEPDAAALLSRCVRIDLCSRVADLELAFACRARRIAQIEGLDGKPIDRYVTLVRREHGNMRAVLAAIESGELSDSYARKTINH